MIDLPATTAPHRQPPYVSYRHPLPPGRGKATGDMSLLRQTIARMKPGGSFVWDRDNKHPYHAARAVGAVIVTRKLPEGGWRIWRRS